MYLTRLEISGFKSFAEKFEVDFGDGITAIVGPNGCGKTNLVDAIRWVLGEQRIGSLRGGRMEDVIFAGSSVRKPLGMAEVSLTIENSKNILPIEFSEITVTRRLFRSGESDYLLNKIPCRLMDITNLFMDTGMGPHAYAVIEQGMVENIISGKAEDLRRLFEEAAGITKYKARRKSAWGKLSSIKQDLLRIDDIIAEVERQVDSLKRQERRARRYQSYLEELKKLELSLGQFRFFSLKNEAEPLAEEIEVLRRKTQDASSQLSTRETRLEKLRLDLVEKERELSAATAELNRNLELIHQKDGEIIAVRERLKACDQMVSRSSREEEETIERLASTERRREKSQEELAQIVDRISVVANELKTRETEASELESSFEAKRSLLESEKEKLMDLFRQHAERSRDLERAKAERDSLISGLKRLTDEERRVSLDLEVARKMVQMATSEAEEIQKKIEMEMARRDRLVLELREREKDLSALQEKRAEVKVRIEANQSALSLWEKIKESYEGYSQSVKALMLGSPYRDRIRGVVADLVEVEGECARAIEAALGESLQYLVTDETRTSAEAINFLKNEGKGRATFLPLDRLGDGAEDHPRSTGKGVVGRALDFLHFDEELAPVVRLLLGRTLVVEDLETALSFPQGDRGPVRLVTLDGETVEPSGQMTGGNPGDDRGGLVGRVRQIRTLRQEIDRDLERLDQIGEEIQRLESSVAEATSQVSQAEAEIVQLRDKLAELERRRLQGESEAKGSKERMAAIAKERGDLENRVSELSGVIALQENELSEIEARKEGLELASKEYEQALRSLEGDRGERSEIVHRLRVQMASLNQKRESLKDELGQLEETSDSLRERIEGQRREAAETRREIERLEEKRGKEEVELECLYGRQSELGREKSSREEEYRELGRRAEKLEGEIRDIRKAQEECKDRLYNLELSYSDLTSKADVIRERMKEDHKVDVEELGPPEMEGGFDPNLVERLIQETRERMRTLGPVNLAALEEYKVQKERYEFLTKQRDDLLESEDTLRKTISRIDRTARSKFLDTFEEIRENFARMFVNFFDGGEADLELAEGEDPLEAAIRITARPQGKRFSNINLLSSGERALTAIALLFAIYLVKPSPFCILDEVDATLDDANIGRFVRAIKEFAKDTQIIVVTHNKKTMEEADCLHGVTMEEAGVSKLVSVRLDRSVERRA